MSSGHPVALDDRAVMRSMRRVRRRQRRRPDTSRRAAATAREIAGRVGVVRKAGYIVGTPNILVAGPASSDATAVTREAQVVDVPTRRSAQDAEDKHVEVNAAGPSRAHRGSQSTRSRARRGHAIAAGGTTPLVRGRARRKTIIAGARVTLPQEGAARAVRST